MRRQPRQFVHTFIDGQLRLLKEERSVPALYGRDTLIVTQDAHRCRIEEEKTTFLGSKSKPPRTKGPEKVSMSEQRQVALHRTHLFYDTIDPTLNLIGAFPTGATICKNHP